MTAATLLIVDDDDVLRPRLGRALSDRGYEVSLAAGYEEAMALARREPPELALVDLRMPGPSGITLIRDLLQLEPHMRIVVLTGYGSIATAVEAMRIGAIHYLSKPADADEVVAAFERAEESAPIDSGQLSAPSLARAEWEHINRVLSDCDGNISEAARRLGIHRRSLQRKLQKYPPRR